MMPAFAALLHLTGGDAAKCESHPIITDGRAGVEAFPRRRDWSALLDPLDAGLRDELLKYGDLVQATYDAFDRRHWSPHCGTCVHGLHACSRRWASRATPTSPPPSSTPPATSMSTSRAGSAPAP